ncbi:MAG: hypothetical protein OIF56_14855 [Cohaesibacter sp.]|nr:hypothetical protein [Cohaesibacter sp.]
MQEFFEAISPRHLVMVAGALLAALLSPDLSMIQRCAAFAAGLFGAYIGTNAALTYFELDQAFVPLVAGGLALTGNNLVKTVLRVSRDPVKFWQNWRNSSK